MYPINDSWEADVSLWLGWSLVTLAIAKQKSLEWPSIIDSFQRTALDPDGPFRAYKSLYKTHLCINESVKGQRVAGVKCNVHIR